MKRFILTAVCTSTLAFGSWATAQTVGNALGQAGDAIERAAGRTQNAVENTLNAAGNQLGVPGATNTNPPFNAGTQRINGVTNGSTTGNWRDQSTSDLNQRAMQGDPRATVPNYSGQQPIQTPGNYGVQQAYSAQGGYGANQPGYQGVQQTSGMQIHGNQMQGGQMQGSQWHANQGSPMMHGGDLGGHAMMAGHSATNGVYRLHYDPSGREFICVRGQRVYFDQQSSNNMMNSNQMPSGSGQDYEARKQESEELPSSSDAPIAPSAPVPDSNSNGSANDGASANNNGNVNGDVNRNTNNNSTRGNSGGNNTNVDGPGGNSNSNSNPNSNPNAEIDSSETNNN